MELKEFACGTEEAGRLWAGRYMESSAKGSIWKITKRLRDKGIVKAFRKRRKRDDNNIVGEEDTGGLCLKRAMSLYIVREYDRR